MKNFAARSPVIFEVILIIAAFVLALAFGIPCQLAGIENELCMAIGRILAGIVLLIVFRGCLKDGKQYYVRRPFQLSQAHKANIDYKIDQFFVPEKVKFEWKESDYRQEELFDGLLTNKLY